MARKIIKLVFLSPREIRVLSAVCREGVIGGLPVLHHGEPQHSYDWAAQRERERKWRRQRRGKPSNPCPGTSVTVSVSQ